jgi:putative effector of murein hydrolase
VLVGGIVAAATALVIASLLGAPEAVLRSIAVKSVTAPIAIGVAEQIGGVASLAAAFAVLTGVAGCILSPWLLHRIGVTSPEAVGLATGVTAHGQGTARMLSMDETAGAFASVGMGGNALATAVWLPVAVSIIGLG